LFPHQRALDEGAAGLEEERRLAYVGLTRAKRRAIVSTAANRRIHGQWQSALPSRFIGELPQDQIEVEAPRGLGGQAAQVQMASSFFDFDTPPPRLARRSAQVESPNYRRQSSGDFSLGDRIRHGKFGEGIVIAIEADKLTINFDTAGEKRVMDSFVERL
jgi:DNA helicase-2/ATP-dependent DNA helicase PcrA